MGIYSEEVRYGRNAETYVPKDSSFVRCKRCGFMCSTDRDTRAPYRSSIGQGISHPEIVEYDGGPDATPVEYDGQQAETEAIVNGPTTGGGNGMTYDTTNGYMGNVIYADRDYTITSVSGKVSNQIAATTVQFGIGGWDPAVGLTATASIVTATPATPTWVTGTFATAYTLTQGNSYWVALMSPNGEEWSLDATRGSNGMFGTGKASYTVYAGSFLLYITGTEKIDEKVSYDGYRSDFTITGGCPFCGVYTYDKEEYNSPRQ